MNARTSLTLAALLVSAAVSYVLGETYVGRLPHHQGYFLVPVEDEVAVGYERPRHTIVILVDGLGRSFAERLDSTRRLRSEGQCRAMTVGPITVSRPMYALLSTGLEQDRSGARNNDETSALAADSVWRAAREVGLDVGAVSHLPWWKQLFPDAFGSYEIAPLEANSFANLDLRDWTLVHPVYVDEAGHRHGAASPEYATAVARVDREIGAFLDGIDFRRDLVVLTADHGHTSYGGHGGPQMEVAEVLTCFAGRGVARRPEQGHMDPRSFAPALAFLAGVRFPRHMRALEDDLDVIFDIGDRAALPAPYVADRRRAVDRFREANAEQLERWLGTKPASWGALYERERRKQRARLAAAAALWMATAGLVVRKSGSSIRSAWRFVVGCALTIATTVAAYVGVRGSFDFTSINARGEFIRWGGSVTAAVAIGSLAARALGRSDARRIVQDEIALLALVALANALHPFVYGWPLGFPLPGAQALFFPFFAPLFVMTRAAIIGVVWFAIALRERLQFAPAST